jgi:hypothetical protein
MSDIDEAGRTLIALADDAHDPTDADRARVRAALSGRLGAVAGLGFGTVAGLGATAKAAASAGGAASAAAASAGGAGAAVAGGTLATKLVGVAVAITTAVGVGASVKLALRSAQAPVPSRTAEIAHRRAVAAAPPALPAPAREQPTSAARSAVRPAVDPAPGHVAAKTAAPSPAAPQYEAPSPVAPPSEARSREANNTAPSVQPPPLPEAAVPATMDMRDAIGAAPHRPATTAAGARDQVCAPPRRSDSAVADEARLVHDGVSALRAGQAACALSLLEAHARFYPEGVLAEEREAERALALADLGRVAEARLAAAAFLRRHPTSPLGVRLRHRIPGIDGAAGSR